MAEVIRMPKLSDTMTEGIIAEWLKKVGDTIKAGDVLAEVETDKATMELESFVDGTLLYIGLEKGQATPVDAIIAVVGAPNEDYKAYISNGAAPQTAPELPASTPAPEPPSKPETKIEPATAPAAPINATLITMPKLTDSMAEGTLVTWLKKVGDPVKVGDLIAEVETDKATMELEAFEDGVLLYIGVEEGQAVPVDTTIAIIGEAGADYKALLNPAATKTPAPVETPAAPANPAVDAPSQAQSDDARVKASPLAKKIAEDKGIDLSHIAGSGDGGRIVKRDLDAATPAKTVEVSKPIAAPSTQPVAQAPQVSAQTAGDFEDTPVSSMRKTIARRLAESKFTAPHFYLTMEINMDKAMALRGPINEASPVKISFNDMVIKASALALRKHPAVNSAWLGDKIRKYNYVNVGVAVAVEDGLLVPVIRDADKKSLSGIAAEVKDLAGKAKDKKLQPKDWEGNTFSISNLGMFGIEQFTAIINPPDSCILAVGAIKETVAHKEGQFYATNVMKVTLSCDHRVVDGALGAAFLQTLKQLLENPMAMLV